MSEIILEKRYPHSRSEDITDAFMRGYVKGKADRAQGEWIPCSEEEPNEFVDVLVCLADGTMDVVQLTDYIGIDGEPKWCHGTCYTLGGAILNSDVVAWMPLPKPWKGADDEMR